MQSYAGQLRHRQYRSTYAGVQICCQGCSNFASGVATATGCHYSTYLTLFAYRSHIQEVLPASTFDLLQSTTASFKDATNVTALAQLGFRDCATLEVSHILALSCASCHLMTACSGGVLQGLAAQEAMDRGFQVRPAQFSHLFAAAVPVLVCHR